MFETIETNYLNKYKIDNFLNTVFENINSPSKTTEYNINRAKKMFKKETKIKQESTNSINKEEDDPDDSFTDKCIINE